MRRANWMLAVAVTTALVGACNSSGPINAYNAPAESARNPVEADRLSRQAADAIERGDLDSAERLLRRALAHDLYWGPAHNNLGVVFLERAQLYEAANEFEWARKLMPSQPDPRVNLGICLDRAGRSDDAMASFEAALEISPEHLPAIQGAALVAARSGREEPRLAGWLVFLSARSEPKWVEWAAAQRSRLARGSTHGEPRD
jgi:tetratricopeptide (TPR) repeat protein